MGHRAPFLRGQRGRAQQLCQAGQYDETDVGHAGAPGVLPEAERGIGGRHHHRNRGQRVSGLVLMDQGPQALPGAGQRAQEHSTLLTGV